LTGKGDALAGARAVALVGVAEQSPYLVNSIVTPATASLALLPAKASALKQADNLLDLSYGAYPLSILRSSTNSANSLALQQLLVFSGGDTSFSHLYSSLLVVEDSVLNFLPSLNELLNLQSTTTSGVRALELLAHNTLDLGSHAYAADRASSSDWYNFVLSDTASRSALSQVARAKQYSHIG
jgi:hypothetical protein